MNEIVNMFLLGGDKFMSETHLKQPGFTYSACGPFTRTKNKERIHKFKQTGNSRYIYQNELDKDRFQHDMAYGYCKDLTGRTVSNNILCGKAFNIAINRKDDGYQISLTSMFYILFDEKSSGRTIKNENVYNKKLADKLHKPIIRNFDKRKLQSSFTRFFIRKPLKNAKKLLEIELRFC